MRFPAVRHLYLCRALYFLAVYSAFMLSACGGGASNSMTTNPPPASNPSPSVTSLSPSSATAGVAATSVTVNGSGFIQGSTVQWNQSNRTTTFVSATQLQAAVTAADLATAGTAQVTVVNPAPGGGTSSAATFTVNNPVPVIASMSQSSANAGAAGFTMTITGTGFVPSSTVQWNQANRAATYVSPTQLQVAVTAADMAVGGTELLTVINGGPGGGASAAATFTVNNPAPQVSSISPATLTTSNAGSTLTVNGSGFVSNSTVTLNGSSRATTYVSATQLRATLLAGDVAAVGSFQVSVSNPTPGGGASTGTPLTIVYPVPSITSLNPPGVAAGGPAFTLSVNGAGFQPSSIIQVNGVDQSTTYVNSTLLQTPLSSALIASPSSLQITVFTGTPGGGTSSALNLVVGLFPTPAITAINPTSIVVNSLDTPVTIQGSGFTGATTLQVNGTTLNINGWSPNFVGARIPAADLTSVGPLSITASNPGPLTSNAVTINVVPIPVPTISSLSPTSAAAGGAGFTLTVSGSNFVPSSVVQWNGSARPTTFKSSSQLTIAVSASDIQTLGNNLVTVVNPTPGGGASNALGFTAYLPLPANDLVYNPTTQLLYASVPSSGGPSLGNSIVPIDPYTGNLGTPIYVGSEPGKMALSSDGSVVWVALNDAGAVREVNLNTQTAGLQINLGGGTGVYNPPGVAKALAVMPGHPDTVAVAGSTNFGYQSLVTIYDSGVARTNAANGVVQCCSGVTGLAFDPTGSKLYEVGNGYGLANVDSTGITSATSLNSSVSSNALDVDNGRAYLTTGAILDANLGTQVGVFSVGQNQNANGPVVSDSTLNEAFVLVSSNAGSIYQINAYNSSNFVLKGSFSGGITNSFPYPNPTSLVRWGQDGLAFTNGSQIYILRSTLVRDLSTSLADLSISASAPTTGTTGADITYSLTISNAGPVTAAPATLIDNIPDGSTFKSVTPSQGSCTGGAVVRCDLGNLTSGSSATVQIIATALSSGTLTNTATVSAPEGDPDTTNNTATSSTAVTGNTYNPAPAMTSISPSFVQAGSASFTLTVNGSGFGSASTVQLNGTVLPTTFVNSSQLTANVDASNVTTLGWGWINVSNPTPGGGTSSSLPLSVYQTISLDVNHMIFDPFTGKLYASVPSTATQVTGNSLVAIDPSAGSVGTPINLGSEPDPMAESADGKYLYVGLDGAKSVTQVDLTAMMQGPVFPVTIQSFGQTTQVAPRGVAVNPANDNLLALDLGSSNGTGLFDIAGSTITARTKFSGIYTGSDITFANATTLYSYDTDTSGAEFYIWTVTATGLTLNNNTGYTLNGIGGFGGAYQLANGIVYGVGGGVADPRTTPPTQLGQFNVYAAQGSGQSIEGTGVAADPVIGRVFITGETLAGSANPVLMAFDPSTFELQSMQQFTGSAQAQDLVRWGRDGLAWHTSSSGAFGNSTPGKGQITLVRGPFVLPEWGLSNSAATVTSASPSSVTAGGGNLTLTVSGTNFVPGAVVLWNNLERSTAYVDSSHLSVSIPASDVAQSGTATLVVNNPGASNSSSISFTIN